MKFLKYKYNYFSIILCIYFANKIFANNSLKEFKHVGPEVTCSLALTQVNIDIIANNMANLYLELFHRQTSFLTQLSPELEASNQALWNDKLFEVETDWPGISILIKRTVNKLLPEHLNVTYTQLNSEQNQKVIDEHLLNEFEIEDKKWNICRRTQQVQDEITKQLGKTCDEITKEDLLKITILDLSNKNISNLYEYDFWGLTNLEELYLNNNLLKVIHKNQFQGLKQLKWLSLLRNNIKIIHEELFSELKQLEWLSLSYNKIKKIHEKQFHNMIELKSLLLNGNKIKKLHESQFYNLKKLEILSLQDNDLKTFYRLQFQWLEKIEELDLRGNPIDESTKEWIKGDFDETNLELRM